VERLNQDNTTDIEEPCDLLITHEFRALIHRTGVDFAASLGPQALEFVQNGTHVEQFHHFKTPSDAMSVHTDAGVFIVMTSQWRDGATNALMITSPLNDTVKVEIPKDTVVIMGGEAFGRSKEFLGTSVHAVPHAPVIPPDMGSTRLWFGEMFLPADDYDLAPDVKMDKWYHSESAASMACLYAGKMMDPRSMCPPDESLCWMSCVKTDCTCRNTTSGGTCDPSMSFHHPQCISECPGDVPVTPFCEPGNDINMFMNGFNSILFGADYEPCLLFYFQNWTINTRLKFWLSFLGYMLLGVFSEFVVFSRRKLNQLDKSSAIRLSLYTVNVTLGYLVMLATMTYAVEMFFAAIIGLSIGHLIFSLNDKSAVVSQTTACCLGRTSAVPGASEQSGQSTSLQSLLSPAMPVINEDASLGSRDSNKLLVPLIPESKLSVSTAPSSTVEEDRGNLSIRKMGPATTSKKCCKAEPVPVPETVLESDDD